MGASVIEKHFTLNKKSKGPDHASSIEPWELKILTEGAKAIFQSKGGVKKIHKKEIPIIKWARESVVSLTNILSMCLTLLWSCSSLSFFLFSLPLEMYVDGAFDKKKNNTTK